MKRIQCPKCLDRGQDNLVIFPDGHGYCFACGYLLMTMKTKNEKRNKKTSVVVPSNAQTPCSGIEHKNIKQDTLVKWGVLEIDDSYELVFPYYDTNKKLIGLKYRDFYAETELGKPKKETISVDGELDFFGLHMCGTRRELYIWEGETDTLNAYQQLPMCNHVGIPGTAHLHRILKKNAMWIREFYKIIICFDNDDAGREAMAVAEELLPSYKLWTVALPADVKDVTDLCMQRKSQFKEVVKRASPLKSSNLLTGDVLCEGFMTFVEDPLAVEGFDTGYDCINAMLGGGLRRGEVFVLTAHTGRGKSTLTANIAHEFANAGHKILWVGTEMLPVQMVRKFLEIHYQQRMYDNSKLTFTQDQIQKGLEFVSKQIIFYGDMPHNHSVLEDDIISAVLQHDVSIIVIDVLNDVDNRFTDWRVAYDIMGMFNRIAQGDPKNKQPPVAVVLVSHTIRRDGKYSKKIELSDIAGGAAVTRRATCVIAMDGDVGEDIRTLRIIKRSRMYDSDLNTGKVYFDAETRRYYEVDEDDAQ